MKHLPLSRLAIAAFAAASLGAQAAKVADEDFGYDTTEDLYMVCSTPSDAAEYIPAAYGCRAFLEATVQYHDGIADRRTMPRLICYPKTATVADGRRAFVAWAEANSGNAKLMEEQPVEGVVRALAEAYPCK